jgi:S-DNA-T family DNA segregation ATPase FtsK/SpoIIIE
MAKKQPEDSRSTDENRGLHDIVGIALLLAAFLIAMAQFSFDRADLAFNLEPPNSLPRNWVGPIGARLGYGLFFVFGACAYFLPVILGLIGLGCFIRALSPARRRWAWIATLFLCCAGLFDLHSSVTVLHRVAVDINAPSAGGWIGGALNQYFFNNLGKPGATFVYLTLYFVCLLFLTDFELSAWLRHVARRLSGKPVPATEEERVLEERSRALEREAKKLQNEVDRAAKQEKKGDDKKAPPDKSGLGQDLKPVPEPIFRDLSVPKARAAATPAKPATDAPVQEGEVISAREIMAATSSDVLGKSAPAKGKAIETSPVAENPEPPSAPAPANSLPAELAKAEPAAPAPFAKPKLAPKKPKPITVAATPLIGNYQLPPLDFLVYPDTTVRPTESREELMSNARLMQNTLAQFDIEVALGDITKGPTITRYELHPAPGVRLEKIAALGNNIAAALKAERINILAPVPGKSSVGVEVPNLVKTKVIMRDLLESEEWLNTKARIPLALGKDVYGQPIIADLAEMPHLLIAGSTGSGKSVCINSIIASLLYKYSPDQLRFVMIDPKVVELQQYNALPHLVVPVVNDPKKVILALRWVVNEMEKRYQIFAKVAVRNIKSFNERPKNKPAPPAEPELPLTVKKEKIEAGAGGFAVELDEEIVVPRDEEIIIPERLSYIVVIIDELADLMLVAPADVEMAIARITQMARAAGIHCIVATQRPSVDVITGVIKANIPARIAFQVAAKVDSRTILDAMGADKLLGKGDMLYLPPGSARLIRAQGVLITDQEIQSMVDFIARQGKPSYEVEIHQQLSKPVTSTDDSEGGSDEDEDLIEQCIEVIRGEQKASVSLLQRRLRLGYGRAARIMDTLEDRGIVGPSRGAEPRDILLDLDGGGADGNPRQV